MDERTEQLGEGQDERQPAREARDDQERAAMDDEHDGGYGDGAL